MTTTTLSITPGVGGPVATDLIAASNYQVVKVAVGVEGTATYVSSTNPIPAQFISPQAVVVGEVIPGTAVADLGKATGGTYANGNTGVMALAVRNDAGTSFVANGQNAPFSTDANGNIRVVGLGTGGTSQVDATAFTRTVGSVTPISARVETAAPSLTNGLESNLSQTTGGALRVDISSGGVAGNTHDSPALTEGILGMSYASNTPPTAVSAAGDAVRQWATLNGAVVTASFAQAVGGGSSYSFLSTAAVQAAAIKASAATLYTMEFFNINATPVYVRIYNQVASPGTGDAANIIWRGMVPGNTAAAGFVVNFGPSGRACGTGLGIRVTSAIADNDNTVLVVNTVMGNLQYA